MLAGAARGEMGSKGGGGRVRLLNVDTKEFEGFQNELICHFILGQTWSGVESESL